MPFLNIILLGTQNFLSIEALQETCIFDMQLFDMRELLFVFTLYNLSLRYVIEYSHKYYGKRSLKRLYNIY